MPGDPDEHPSPPEARQAAERTITAAYRAILRRDPDPAGLSAWCEQLVSGRVELQGLLDGLLHSDEFAERTVEFLTHYVRPEKLRFTNDVSQYGEIWIWLREMVNAAAAHRIVVDVGARGRMRSNSYDLLRHFGWRGLLIEANTRLIESISADFAGLDVTLVNCAVSDYAGAATFYVGVNDDVSSLRQDAASGWGSIRGRVNVRVERLGAILRTYDIPFDFDLLSIDAEGEDIAILNDVVLSGYVPRWVIIEASADFRTKSLRDLPLLAAVIDRYTIVGQTVANLLLRANPG
jgi:FkbM family methyltransferase